MSEAMSGSAAVHHNPGGGLRDSDERSHTEKHTVTTLSENPGTEDTRFTNSSVGGGVGGADDDLDMDTGLDLEEEPSVATLTKAISRQPGHYMLTFNGLHDDDAESDSEVEELTKALSSSSDGNNNNNNSNTNSHRGGAVKVLPSLQGGVGSSQDFVPLGNSQSPGFHNNGDVHNSDRNAHVNLSYPPNPHHHPQGGGGGGVALEDAPRDFVPGVSASDRGTVHVPAGTMHHLHQHHHHHHQQQQEQPLTLQAEPTTTTMTMVHESSSHHTELQIPSGDSDTDHDPDLDLGTSGGGFLHVADDGNSSVRPDTPTPSTPRTPRTRISVDALATAESRSSSFDAPPGFVRPKPLSGSTTAMCGSVENLQYFPGGRTFSETNKRFSASELNLSLTDTPRPVEGTFTSAFRRRAFHQSINRLSLGSSMPSWSMSSSLTSNTVNYASDGERGGVKGGGDGGGDDGGESVVLRRAPPPTAGRKGLNRRWSLAHADADALDEIRLLQNQLDKVEKEKKKMEKAYQQELHDLRRDNERQQKLIGQNLNLGPEAKIEATMQHEITRMTSENLDLREMIDKQSDQIRKLKKMLKVYAKKLKDGEAAEIAAELDQEDGEGRAGAAVGASVIVKDPKERSYMGMLEYRREDEGALVKNLILELKPKTAAGLLPGLPAYCLFMCVRHTDYINDDDKVKSLLTATINGIKKIVKKHSDDLERVTLWLANTCRLMHTLKQYSGEKAFQTDNQPRQNEMCLRNFDLSEYRQVFSDLAIWIYQTLIKLMQELLQPSIVPAILEHEAIAGLTAKKPSGLRGRSSSNATDLDNDKDNTHSLDALMRTLNSYMRILTQHAVDPELVKQIIRQLYYFLCAGALNNLLLRKDMCNWSKGMQIRYNLSHLEQWLRDNKLNESGAAAALEPIVQASQLLQARKYDADAPGICDMCSKLTQSQIVKILNLYTPVDEFEERVPVSFIRTIQATLKDLATRDPTRQQQQGHSTLLMDTKMSFPVTFPFNPSSIMLDTVTIPEVLHLGFVHRL